MLLSRFFNIKTQFLILLITVTISIIGIISINVFIHNDNSHRLAQLENLYYPALESATKISTMLPSIKQQFDSAVVMEDEQALEVAIELSKTLQVEADLGAKLHPNQQNKFREVKSELKKYTDNAYSLSMDFISLNDSIQNLSSRAKENNKIQSQLLTKSIVLQNSIREQVVNNISYSEKVANNAATISILTGIISVLILVVIGYAIFHSVTKSIAIVTEKMHDIANGNGDLTARIEYQGKDEVAGLVLCVNSFISKLQGIISTTIKSGDELKLLTQSIEEEAQKSTQLNLTQQKHIGEVTYSIDGIISLIHQVVQYSTEANNQAIDANTKAQSGADIVFETSTEIENLAIRISDTAQKLQELEENTNHVGSILSTIQNVAEQTNLLALNAAIEAARAGEHGRGFAVVADEVRILASNTQKSATEISELLESLQNGTRSAVDAMSAGLNSSSKAVETAKDAGYSLQEITSQFEKNRSLNEQISDTTSQQNSSSNLINNRMSDFNECSTHVSNSAKQLEHLSHNLSDIVAQLSSSTSQFKV